MYDHVCIDLALFDQQQWCILTHTYPLSTFGWLEEVEKGWKRKFEFSSFLENFDKIRACSLARVSCCLLAALLGIYRRDWKGKRNGFIFFLKTKKAHNPYQIRASHDIHEKIKFFQIFNLF